MPPIGEVIRVFTARGRDRRLHYLTVKAIEDNALVCTDGETHARLSRDDVQFSYGKWWVF